MTAEQGGWLPSPDWRITRSPDFTVFEKAALGVLWTHSEASGESWPKLETIAAEMPADLKSARKAVNGLVAKGVVTKIIHPARVPHYLIRPETVLAYCLSRPTGNGTSESGTSTSGPTGNGMADLPETVPQGYHIREVRPTGNGTRRNTNNGEPITENQDVIIAAAIPQPVKSPRVRKEKAIPPDLQAAFKTWQVTGHPWPISAKATTEVKTWLEAYGLELVQWVVTKAAAEAKLGAHAWMRVVIASEHVKRQTRETGPPSRNGTRTTYQDQGGDFFGPPSRPQEVRTP